MLKVSKYQVPNKLDTEEGWKEENFILCSASCISTYPLTSYGEGTSLAVASIFAMTTLGLSESCKVIIEGDKSQILIFRRRFSLQLFSSLHSYLLNSKIRPSSYPRNFKTSLQHWFFFFSVTCEQLASIRDGSLAFSPLPLWWDF